MTELEKLNERVTQLTELVKTGSEAIKNMEAALKAAEEEINRLANQRREQEPRFERVEENEKYYCIIDFCRCFDVSDETEEHCVLDETAYNNNNYFHTHERAQEVLDKINLLLKLERLHDTFCPDYVPDWNNCNEGKATVFYHHSKKQYVVQAYSFMRNPTSVYFPTSEIAQKVCDILNRDLEEKI